MILTKQLECSLPSLENKSAFEKTFILHLNLDGKTPKYLIHKSISIQDNNRRKRNASCKTRTEVAGGGKKPWKQKGTGRARSGSNASPLWKGGGVVFGPKPQVYRKKINRKEKRLALNTVLYNSKYKIQIVNDLTNCVDKISTKSFLSFVNEIESYDPSKMLLIILHKYVKNLSLSTRNIPFVTLKYPNSVTIKDIISSDSIFLTEEALLAIFRQSTN